MVEDRMERATSDVLLVEDDPGQARLAERTLHRAGFAVHHVADAQACLRRVREQPPRFVLLDRGLPDGDGLDVLRRLHAEFPAVCVIMLTAADDARVAVDAMQLGASDYVVKRPDLSHLSDLPRVLNRNRERLRLMHERQELDHAVRASEARYRELFENASDAIFVCDTVGRLRQVNRAFVKLTGHPRDTIEGKDLGTFLAPTTPTRAEGLHERSLHAAEHATTEVHLLSTAGRTTVLDVTTRPIFSDGVVSGFQAIGRDVTERRQIEQMKADFLAMITHDMKNPVGIIVGYAEILLDDSGVASEFREMLVSIDASARGLLQLILNFLDLSKIEAGALRLHRVQTCINDVLRQVVRYQSPLARAKGIEVIEQLGQVPAVQVDHVQMDRVFGNLLGNAIKFTPPGGRVSIHTARQNGQVEVRISDTGPGIAPEQIPQLFGKYQRLSPAPQTEGTGLGLFIAKSMVDAHGGVVRVESTPNHGATFIVSLPVETN
jgi:PAS domain S-box-containing protein